MESINTHKIKYKFIAILMALVIAITPFSSIHRVKANTIEDTLKFGIPVVALILAALTSNGAISGGYKVSPADLSSITEKAQTNLQAAGTNAVEQANRLGEAIKSGATSSAIKKLAQGSVIWAFLGAIQDVLWSDIKTDYDKLSPDNSLNGYHFVRSALLSGGNYVYLFQADGVSLDLTEFTFSKSGASTGRLYYNNSAGTANTYNSPRVLFKTATMSEGVYPSIYGVELYCNVSKADESIVKGYTVGAATVSAYFTGLCLGLVNNNSISDISISNIAGRENITIPTVLPQTIINNITNWDGTSDLVLAPPLPYDIPTGEDLVIDPSYTGSEVEDPDTPDIPDKPEDIDMPWLSALLALLGLGNPSLDGIEAGVKTAIDTIIDGITATAQDVFDGSKEIFGNITDALTGIDAGIQSGIDALTSSISVPLTNIADFALSVPDFFAIPEGKSIATPIIEQIPQVFPIVDQMNTALNKITVQTRPLIIYYPYLDGTTKEINLNWYEPAREQVKHGVGLLFKVVTALACFAMVSNVFGIGIRVGTGQAYIDNNSGGGSGNSRKKED